MSVHTLRIAKQKKVEDQPCRACNLPATESHHIVPRSRMPKRKRKRHPKLHHMDNIMPVCHGCHQDHHTTAHKRIPRNCLTDSELAFALKHTSHRWVDLWYPDDHDG